MSRSVPAAIGGGDPLLRPVLPLQSDDADLHRSNTSSSTRPNEAMSGIWGPRSSISSVSPFQPSTSAQPPGSGDHSPSKRTTLNSTEPRTHRTPTESGEVASARETRGYGHPGAWSRQVNSPTTKPAADQTGRRFSISAAAASRSSPGPGARDDKRWLLSIPSASVRRIHRAIKIKSLVASPTAFDGRHCFPVRQRTFGRSRLGRARRKAAARHRWSAAVAAQGSREPR